MSSTVYEYKTVIFPNRNTTLFQYLHQTLFLQNLEHLVLYEKTQIFLEYLDYILFDENSTNSIIKDKELKEINNSFDKKKQLIKKLLDKIKKCKSPPVFYEFIETNCTQPIFLELFELIIQRILLIMVKILRENEKSDVVSSFDDIFESIKFNKLSDNMAIVIILLKFLRKNCRIYCAKPENPFSKFLTVDENYPCLFLLVSSKYQLKFLKIEEIPESSKFYAKITVPIEKKDLIKKLKCEMIEKNTSEIGSDDDDEDFKNEEESSVENIYISNIKKIFNAMINYPEGPVNHEEIVAKILSQIQKVMKVEKKNLKEKAHKLLNDKFKEFINDLDNVSLKSKKNLDKFQKNWREKNEM